MAGPERECQNRRRIKALGPDDSLMYHIFFHYTESAADVCFSKTSTKEQENRRRREGGGIDTMPQPLCEKKKERLLDKFSLAKEGCSYRVIPHSWLRCHEYVRPSFRSVSSMLSLYHGLTLNRN